MGIYWVYPLLKGSLGVKQLGHHPKGTSIFPFHKFTVHNYGLLLSPLLFCTCILSFSSISLILVGLPFSTLQYRASICKFYYLSHHY